MRSLMSLMSDWIRCPYKAFRILKGETDDLSPCARFMADLDSGWKRSEIRAVDRVEICYPATSCIRFDMSVKLQGLQRAIVIRVRPLTAALQRAASAGLSEAVLAA